MIFLTVVIVFLTGANPGGWTEGKTTVHEGTYATVTACETVRARMIESAMQETTTGTSYLISNCKTQTEELVFRVYFKPLPPKQGA